MAQTVILLHSSASSSRQWQALGETLAPRFDVRAVDLHGHGAQPAFRGHTAMTLADDAALAVPLLAACGGAHVVGHSYGGAVALKLAAMEPRLVHSVTVFEPVLFRWLVDDPDLHAAAADVLGLAGALRRHLARNATHDAAERFIDFWSGEGAFAAMPQPARETIAARMPVVRAHFEALLREPMTPAGVRRLPMPMLFLRGAETVPATRCIANVLRAALPDAEHDVLAGRGHLGPMTPAQKVNRRIAQFLRADVAVGAATG